MATLNIAGSGEATSWDNGLACPCCGETYLHHSQVTVYDRDEDAEHVTRIEVRRGRATRSIVSNTGSGNPGARRDGLAIRFWCEGCTAISELTIEQHKGSSYVGWRIVGEQIDAAAE
jgi:hypothetical protein